VPLTKGEDGSVRFDAIVTAQHKGQVVHSRFSDLVEKDTSAIQLRPNVDEEAAAAAKTRAALESIVQTRITTSRPTHIAETAQNKAAEAQIIRYTPAEDTAGYNAATKQRVIKMVEAAVDPLEPPKFKHKKVPGGPPDAPVPVMHSPPRKVSVADQQAWKIPPCVSNWKNSRGYVIPLDKRVAADGRSMLEPTINDNFAKLSEALLIAERKARDEVETRAAIQKKLAMKQKEDKEAELRDLAARARLERTGVATSLGERGMEPLDQPSARAASAARGVVAAGPLVGYGDDDEDEEQEAGGQNGGADATGEGGGFRSSGGGFGGDEAAAAAPSSFGGSGGGGSGGGGGLERTSGETDEEYRERLERERVRRDRKRERERDFRIESSGRKGKAVRDEDRDMSEKIALGMPVGNGK
jgi:SNW domain-containing protein 1